MTKLTLPKDILKEFILHLITKTFFLFAPSKIQGCKEKVGDFLVFPQEGFLSESGRFFMI